MSQVEAMGEGDGSANRVIRPALRFGAAAAIAGFVAARHGNFTVDFAYFHRAASAVLNGVDPYVAAAPFVYPLTAAVGLVPVAGATVSLAAVIFVALSFGTLAALIGPRWPLLCSFPAFQAAASGQWSPLVLCAAFATSMGWVAALKPTLGLAALVWRGKWQGLAVAVAFGVATLFLDSLWPLKWMSAMRAFSSEKLHFVPVLLPFGFLLLLALLRWREPAARLVLTLSLIPQSPYLYDQLALGLTAETRAQAAVMTVLSYAVPASALAIAPTFPTKVAGAEFMSFVVTFGYYLPVTAYLLWRARLVRPKER